MKNMKLTLVEKLNITDETLANAKEAAIKVGKEIAFQIAVSVVTYYASKAIKGGIDGILSKSEVEIDTESVG